MVLIPHNNKPIPPDGRGPSQVDIMIAGVYNLGYVSLAAQARGGKLIDWWADRLRRDCRVDPVWGYFVDQRWFDLAPGFLTDLAIVRDPEYNVAYWNLHSRRLEAATATAIWSTAGRSAFFHFSGFDPDHPLVLSRYQDRVDVLADPVLERLLGRVRDGGEQRGARRQPEMAVQLRRARRRHSARRHGARDVRRFCGRAEVASWRRRSRSTAHGRSRRG